jgi:hypothetical protein
LYILGEHERALRHLRAAELIATKRGDPARLARVLGYISTHLVFTEAFEQAFDCGTRALDLARASGDGSLRLR